MVVTWTAGRQIAAIPPSGAAALAIVQVATYINSYLPSIPDAASW